MHNPYSSPTINYAPDHLPPILILHILQPTKKPCQVCFSSFCYPTNIVVQTKDSFTFNIFILHFYNAFSFHKIRHEKLYAFSGVSSLLFLLQHIFLHWHPPQHLHLCKIGHNKRRSKCSCSPFHLPTTVVQRLCQVKSQSADITTYF